MRILVTGGAGFVGSHLCDRLLGDGHDVIAMDNLITGSTDNIAHLAGNRRFKFIFHDVTEYIYVPGALDAVMNLASPASPVDFARIPIPILKVGSLGTHNTLGLALAKRARYLIASTSEVYGDPLIHPQPETYWGNVNPIGVRGVYDEAKRFSEAITMAYHRVHGVDTRIIRIFNTYGPRHAAQRWAGGAQLHRSGAAWRAADGVRRRQPNVLVLLRVRSRGWHGAPAPVKRNRSRERRQPGGADDPGVRSDHQPIDGQSSGHRVQAAAGGRSACAQARHHACAVPSWAGSHRLRWRMG